MCPKLCVQFIIINSYGPLKEKHTVKHNDDRHPLKLQMMYKIVINLEHSE